MSLHDSVISGFFGTRSVCVLADISRFAKSGVLGMFQRRFLYQAMLLRCGHGMGARTAGSPHFHQLRLCREQSSEQEIELYFKCTLLYTHIAVEAPVPRQTARCTHDNQPTLSGYTSSAEGSCIVSMVRESSLNLLDVENSLPKLLPSLVKKGCSRIPHQHMRYCALAPLCYFCITKCSVDK